MKLTSQQDRAAGHREGPALVLAVPGAGKTTMLLERTRRLVESGVDPRRILTISFSRASARDMGARLEDLFPSLAGRISFSTIHSFAYSIIRSYERKTGRTYTLLEGAKEGPSKYRVLGDLYRKFNRSYANDDLLDKLVREIGYVKNKVLDPRAFSKSADCQTKNFYPIFQAYEDLKEERGWIDFDDMTLRAIEILENDPTLLRSVRSAYDYVQIDEGQDTSQSQMTMVKMVAHPQQNLFIVADDDQSIYGFRGADVEGLLKLDKTYPDLKFYYLDKNFRSSENIVDLANSFIEKNKDRYKKASVAVRPRHEAPKAHQLRSLESQYRFIVREVQEKDLGSCAVLFRNNICSLGLVEALEKADIPFSCRDSKNAFLYHWVVRDVFDILKFAEDTTQIDLFSKFYYKVFGYISKKNIGDIEEKNRQVSVFKLLKELDGPPYFKKNVRDLEAVFKRIPGKPLRKAIQIIENDLDYRSYISRHAETFGSSEEVSMRILFYLKFIAKGAGDMETFKGRLKHLDYLLRGNKLGPSSITLSTFHGAKGLEFDTVFLIDLIEDIIPSQPRGADPKEEARVLEEERRLFYVAMTRAKSRLYFLTPKTVNQLYTPPSPFYREVEAYIRAEK